MPIISAEQLGLADFEMHADRPFQRFSYSTIAELLLTMGQFDRLVTRCFATNRPFWARIGRTGTLRLACRPDIDLALAWASGFTALRPPVRVTRR